MTSETLKNTFYIIHATVINFSNLFYVKFIIKLIYFTHLQFSIQMICLICYGGRLSRIMHKSKKLQLNDIRDFKKYCLHY